MEWAPLQSNVHVDETPWCVMGVKEWLWTASGEGFCLFHAADTRGRVELETMLGTEFAGVLSSDDFSVYNGGTITAQQKCLAHYDGILRKCWDFLAIIMQQSLTYFCH